MHPPKVGRVFVTKSGEQFCVAEVTTAADLDDPEGDPDFFLVTLVGGRDPDRLDGLTEELTNDELKEWFELHGVSE